MGNLVGFCLATAALALLTLARPRLALYATFAAVPLQFLFLPVLNFFVSPVDAAVIAGLVAFGIRLLMGDTSARTALRRHGWLGAMVAGYLAGFAVHGFSSRTLLRLPLAAVLSLLAYELLRERAHLRRTAIVLVVAGTCDALIGVGFYTTGTWIHPSRFSGVGGPNFSAIIITVAVAIWFVMLSRTAKPRLLALPGVLAAFGLATLSKMGVLAMAASSIVVLPMMIPRNRARLLAAAAVVLGIAVSQQAIRDAVRERMQPAAQNDGIERSSFELRWHLQMTALRGFVQQPVVGLGFGRFQEYSNTNPVIRAATAGVGFGTHNTYLEILAEGGLLAFLPFLLHFRQYGPGLALACRAAVRQKDRTIGAALVGFPIVLFCAAFGNLLLYYSFWAVSGLALAALTIHRKERGAAARLQCAGMT